MHQIKLIMLQIYVFLIVFVPYLVFTTKSYENNTDKLVKLDTKISTFCKISSALKVAQVGAGIHQTFPNR